jgi:hypothetical protein
MSMHDVLCDLEFVFVLSALFLYAFGRVVYSLCLVLRMTFVGGVEKVVKGFFDSRQVAIIRCHCLTKSFSEFQHGFLNRHARPSSVWLRGIDHSGFRQRCVVPHDHWRSDNSWLGCPFHKSQIGLISFTFSHRVITVCYGVSVCVHRSCRVGIQFG